MNLCLITSALSLAGNRKNSQFTAVCAGHLTGVFSKTRLVLALPHLVHISWSSLFLMELLNSSYFFIHILSSLVQLNTCRKSGVIWPKAYAMNQGVINSLLEKPGIVAVFCLFSTLHSLYCIFLFVFNYKLIFYTGFMPLLFVFSSSDPAVQKVRKAINRHVVLNITISQTKYSYKNHTLKLKNTDNVT